MRPIGFNALTDGAPGINEAKLLDAAHALQPFACVVDTLKSFTLLKEDGAVRMPILRVIGQNDAVWHKRMTPFQWVEMMKPVFDAGEVTVQLLNEPHGYEDLNPLAAWIAQVMAIVPTNVTLVVANFGVGHPDDMRITGGEFDAVLKAVSTSHHWLGVHEYFTDDPLSPTERHNKVGRWRIYDQRMKLINNIAETPYPPLKIIVTEHGRDIGGGRGTAGDGWRNSGKSPDEYAAQIISAVRDVYVPRVPAIPVCVFSLGSGFDIGDGKGQEWSSFNIDDPVILQALANANAQLNAPTGPLPPPTPPPAPAIEWVSRKIKTGTQGAYFRKQASVGADKWELLQGNKQIPVDYDPNGDVIDDDGIWRHYRILERVGYIHSTAAELLPVVEPPAPPPVEPPNEIPDGLMLIGATKDEVQQLALLHTQIAAIYTAIMARVGGEVKAAA